MNFGVNLASLRKTHGLSQDQLAEKLSITRQAISKWESGQSMPDLDMVVRLSEILDVSTDELLLEVPSHREKSDEKNDEFQFLVLKQVVLLGLLLAGIFLDWIETPVTGWITVFGFELSLILIFVPLALIPWNFYRYRKKHFSK